MFKNKINVLAAIVIAVATGCAQEVAQLKDLQKMGNIYVEPRTQKPYSGRFVDAYDGMNVIRETGTLKDGKRNGEITIYRKDGSIDSVKNFQNDLLNGVLKTFHESGKLLSEGNYVNGKEHGTLKMFYENGQLLGEVNFVDGKKQGIAKSFYESGKLEEELNFVDDEIHGLTKEFYESGELREAANYVNGKQQGEKVGFYKNGKESRRTSANNSVKVEYYGNGKELSVCQNIGVGSVDMFGCQYFDRNGKIITAQEYSKLTEAQKMDTGSVIVQEGKRRKIVIHGKTGSWTFSEETRNTVDMSVFEKIREETGIVIKAERDVSTFTSYLNFYYEGKNLFYFIGQLNKKKQIFTISNHYIIGFEGDVKLFCSLVSNKVIEVSGSGFGVCN